MVASTVVPPAIGQEIVGNRKETTTTTGVVKVNFVRAREPVAHGKSTM